MHEQRRHANAARIRRWMVALALGLTSVILAAAAPQAHAVCAPGVPLSNCPPPPPQGPSTPPPPVVAVSAPTDVQATSATLNGTVNPEGAAVQYYWVYADASGRYLGKATPTQTLPASTTAQPVSAAISGLRPGVSYTVTLYANNSYRPAGTGPEAEATIPSAFTTPANPIVTISVGRSAIKITQSSRVKVNVSGTFDPDATARIEIAKAPYRRWMDVGTTEPLGSRGTAAASICPSPPEAAYECMGLDRNFEVRAEVQGRYSGVRHVYVFPWIDLSTERERDGGSPYLDLTWSAVVHRAARYPRRTVYFYTSPRPKGPFTRVAHARLHVRGGVQLIARVRIYQPGAVYTLTCTRRQLFSDMGVRFFQRKCGAPRLT